MSPTDVVSPFSALIWSSPISAVSKADGFSSGVCTATPEEISSCSVLSSDSCAVSEAEKLVKKAKSICSLLQHVSGVGYAGKKPKPCKPPGALMSGRPYSCCCARAAPARRVAPPGGPASASPCAPPRPDRHDGPGYRPVSATPHRASGAHSARPAKSAL